MRKKYETLEEVREANRRRAAKWRSEHTWEARVKKARAYGTRTLKVDVKGYGTVEVPEWVLAVALPGSHARIMEEVGQEAAETPEVKGGRTDENKYEADPEDCRTPKEKAMQEHYGRMLRHAHAHQEKEVKQTSEEDRAQAWLDRKKKERGVEVNME